MSLDFPLSVRSRNYFYFFLSRKGERGCVFAVFFAPVPEKEILDFIAHGSIIQVSTVAVALIHVVTVATGIGSAVQNHDRTMSHLAKGISK